MNLRIPIVNRIPVKIVKCLAISFWIKNRAVWIKLKAGWNRKKLCSNNWSPIITQHAECIVNLEWNTQLNLKIKWLLNFPSLLIAAFEIVLDSLMVYHDEPKSFIAKRPFHFSILASVGSEKAQLFQGAVRKPIVWTSQVYAP